MEIILDILVYLLYILPMNNENNIEGLALDAWLCSIPDDLYAPCPCNCGNKMRFLIKKGEKELQKHEDNFIKNFIKTKE